MVSGCEPHNRSLWLYRSLVETLQTCNPQLTGAHKEFGRGWGGGGGGGGGVGVYQLFDAKYHPIFGESLVKDLLSKTQRQKFGTHLWCVLKNK